jgi:hypothetical protein
MVSWSVRFEGFVPLGLFSGQGGQVGKVGTFPPIAYTKKALY